MILNASVFGVTRNGFQTQTYSVTQLPWVSRDLAETFYGIGKIVSGEGVYVVNLRDVTAHFYIRSAGILSSTENARPNAMFGVCVETSELYVRDPLVFAKSAVTFLEDLALNESLVVRNKAADGTDQFAFAVGNFADAKAAIRDVLAKLSATLESSFDRAGIGRSRANVKVWQLGSPSRTCSRNEAVSTLDVVFEKAGSVYVPLREPEELDAPQSAIVVQATQPTESKLLSPSKPDGPPTIPRTTFRREEDRANEQLRTSYKRQRKLVIGLAATVALETVLLLTPLLWRKATGEDRPDPRTAAAVAGTSNPTPLVPPRPDTPPAASAPAVVIIPAPAAESSAALTAEGAQQCSDIKVDTRILRKCYLSDRAIATIVKNFDALDAKSAQELFFIIGKLSAPDVVAPEDTQRGQAIATLNPKALVALDSLIAARRSGTNSGYATFDGAKTADAQTLESALKGVLLSSRAIPKPAAVTGAAAK